jgi:hypothetical protein
VAKRTPSPAEIKAQRRVELIAEANANPNGFFAFGDCGLILGFGENAMGRLSGAGAPVLFRKMNPAMIREWVASNPDKVSKLTEGGDEN